jgi:lipopolysaccharide/colanic/teichoic acid biosynthesis glycosyltransferase
MENINCAHSAPTAKIRPEAAWYVPLKTAGEFLAAFALGLLSLPVVCLAAVLVKLTSAGPAFYSQARLGRNGVPFMVFKLRSMRHDAETQTGPVWSTANDPRITPLGQILRATHIDEFPQLWNVLRGEMSLVGPRPERPEIVGKLEHAIPHYRQRLNVRPGITGLAQLHLPPDSSLKSVQQKLLYDLYYVQHLNPWLDLRILLLTLWQFASSLAGVAWEFFSLPTRERIERSIEQTIGSDADALIATAIFAPSRESARTNPPYART